MAPDPRTVYEQLLAKRLAELDWRERRHRLLGYCKLGAVACGLAVVWLALAKNAGSILWVLIPLTVVIALIVVHETLLRVWERRTRAARYSAPGLARLDGTWVGAGESGA